MTDIVKHAGGRPTKYQEEYCEKIIKFFSKKPYKKVLIGQDKIVLINEKTKKKKVVYRNKYKYEPLDFPTIEGFAGKIGVCVDTLWEWSNGKDDQGKLIHPEFSESYKKAQELQKNLWQVASLYGLYNPAFTIFLGKNVFNWHDKQDIDHTTQGEKLTVGVVSYDDIKDSKNE